MSNTYCGKTCEACEERRQLNCPGCRVGPGKAYGGECSIAKCCISRNQHSCIECTASTTCFNRRSSAGAAANRLKKQNDAVFMHQKLLDRCQLLGERLRALFRIVIISNIFNFVDIDTEMRILRLPLTIIGCSFSVYYAWVLLKLSPVSDHYQTAGISGLIGAVLGFLVEFFELSDLAITLMLVSLVPGFVAQFQEFMGHSEAVEELDADLAAKWRKLWYWYIGCMCAMVSGLLLAMIGLLPVALLVLLASVVGAIVVVVMQVIYLYKTSKICRKYVERYSQIV